MSGFVLCVIVSIVSISLCCIVAVIAESFNTIPTNKFDVINEELSRLHSESVLYTDCPKWITNEIDKLNAALVEESWNE